MRESSVRPRQLNAGERMLRLKFAKQLPKTFHKDVHVTLDNYQVRVPIHTKARWGGLAPGWKWWYGTRAASAVAVCSRCLGDFSSSIAFSILGVCHD